MMAENLVKKLSIYKFSNLRGFANRENQQITLINLPTELINQIFDHLDLVSLSKLSIAAKSTRKLVNNYCFKLKYGYRRLKDFTFKDFLNPADQDEQAKEKHISFFVKLGIVVKRSTCLYPTEERLNKVITFMDKITNGLPSHRSLKKSDANESFVLKCFGTFLHTLIIGWEEDEIIKVFHFLEKWFQLDSVIATVIRSSPSEYSWCEYFIRCFYRYICLDRLLRPEDKLFWINQIIFKYSRHPEISVDSIQFTARLLVILFGPLVRDEDFGTPVVAWAELTYRFFTKEFNLLGQYIQLIETEWGGEKISHLLSSMINLPDPWSSENVASLFYLCGEKIVKTKLTQHFINREIAPSAQLIVYQILVSQKIDGTVSDNILDLVEECLSMDISNEWKRELLLSLPGAFNDAYTEADVMLEVEDERDESELIEIINAMGSLILSLFFRRYPKLATGGTKVSQLTS